MKSLLYIPVIAIGLMVISCGPKASDKAKEYCGYYDSYHQAIKNNDSETANNYLDKMNQLDKELSDKYIYKNPEWLMKYVKLKTTCMAETEAKYSN